MKATTKTLLALLFSTLLPMLFSESFAKQIGDLAANVVHAHPQLSWIGGVVAIVLALLHNPKVQKMLVDEFAEDEAAETVDVNKQAAGK